MRKSVLLNANIMCYDGNNELYIGKIRKDKNDGRRYYNKKRR